MVNLRTVKTGWMVTLAAVMLGAFVLLLPVDVPDANSPLEGNHVGLVNSGTTLGQTFVANRNGLHRIEITVAAEHPAHGENLTFRIASLPWRQIDEVTRPASEVPVGKAIDFRPGTMKERWYSFDFEPIVDSAGKRFFFSLESKQLKEANSLGLLMFFHNRYPPGEAYVNGDPVNAHVVFRAYSRGHLVDLVGVLAERLAADKPELPGGPITLGALGLVYAFLAGGIVMVMRREA